MFVVIVGSYGNLWKVDGKNTFCQVRRSIATKTPWDVHDAGQPPTSTKPSENHKNIEMNTDLIKVNVVPLHAQLVNASFFFTQNGTSCEFRNHAVYRYIYIYTYTNMYKSLLEQHQHLKQKQHRTPTPWYPIWLKAAVSEESRRTWRSTPENIGRVGRTFKSDLRTSFRGPGILEILNIWYVQEPLVSGAGWMMPIFVVISPAKQRSHRANHAGKNGS